MKQPLGKDVRKLLQTIPAKERKAFIENIAPLGDELFIKAFEEQIAQITGNTTLSESDKKKRLKIVAMIIEEFQKIVNRDRQD